MLNETAMLVSLRIKMPPQTRIAQAASTDIEFKYQTSKNQARVNKSLFSKQDIQGLQKLATKTRNQFNQLTLPYDGGRRILPSSQYFKFTEEMRPLLTEFGARRDQFLDDYPQAMSRAQQELGDLFSHDDYKSASELSNCIHMVIDSSVVPPTNAFDELAGLSKEMIEELKEQAAKSQQAKMGDALGDLLQRLTSSVSKAATKLGVEDAIFRDTLVTNIELAVKAVETLNLTGDAHLNDLASKARDLVDGLSAQELREDKSLRKEVAEEAKELANKMGELF